MTTTRFENVRWLDSNGALNDGAILTSGGKIAAIDSGDAEEVVDGRGAILSPGFIELQTNGSFGHDFTGSPGSIWEVAMRLPEQGVTSFLPTLVSPSLDVIEQALEVLQDRPAGFRGAEPLGWHLEGPCLNPEKRGAHDVDALLPVETVDWSRYRPETGVRMVTIAPELDGALDAVRTLAEAGVLVSAGHSLATLAESNAGFDGGITKTTHLFNAMRPLHHREPGLAGATLARDAIVAGLIADGVHVHPSLVATVFDAKSPHAVAMVTDAMAAAGCDDGRYHLAGLDVELRDGAVRLADGTLAGSALALDQAVRNVVQWTELSLEQVLESVTGTPARLLGIDRGKIAVGSAADMVMLDPGGRVLATWVGGSRVFDGGNPHGDA